MKNAQFEIVQSTVDMVFVRDLDRPGYPSVTNDAEWVYYQLSYNTTTKQRRRVIYQDSIGEWTEILLIAGAMPGDWRIGFKPWHGDVWDRLTQV